MADAAPSRDAPEEDPASRDAVLRQLGILMGALAVPGTRGMLPPAAGKARRAVHDAVMGPGGWYRARDYEAALREAVSNVTPAEPGKLPAPSRDAPEEDPASRDAPEEDPASRDATSFSGLLDWDAVRGITGALLEAFGCRPPSCRMSGHEHT